MNAAALPHPAELRDGRVRRWRCVVQPMRFHSSLRLAFTALLFTACTVPDGDTSSDASITAVAASAPVLTSLWSHTIDGVSPLGTLSLPGSPSHAVIVPDADWGLTVM